MFITSDESMRDFNPMEDMEMLSSTDRMCIIRTTNLLPTLFFMQWAWWRLYEMHSDDRWNEAEILIYYKPKWNT